MFWGAFGRRAFGPGSIWFGEHLDQGAFSFGEHLTGSIWTGEHLVLGSIWTESILWGAFGPGAFVGEHLVGEHSTPNRNYDSMKDQMVYQCCDFKKYFNKIQNMCV